MQRAVKHCKQCGTQRPYTEFQVVRHATPTRAEQRRAECKLCTATNMRKRRAATPKPPLVTHRLCTKCGKRKPISQFRRRGNNGHAANCAHCHRPNTAYEKSVARYPLQMLKADPNRAMLRALPNPPASPWNITCPTCRSGPERPCDAPPGVSHHTRLYRWSDIVNAWPNVGRKRL